MNDLSCETLDKTFDVQLGPTAGNNSPNCQDLGVPAFSRGRDLPELSNRSALNPDEDNGQRQHDRLTDHKEI